ncbi:MAG: radical SAM protein [Candidatus Omnitrophota bacterium]
MFFKKEDLLLKGVLDGARAFLGPEIVQFDITNRCNNDCLCCWNNSPLLGDVAVNDKLDKRDELPVDLVKRTIKELRQMGTRTLFFAGGGEPFIHPHIMEILEYAKKNQMRVFINTNFTLVDKERAERIVTAKVDHIHVSLLAGTAPTYAVIHPNKNEDTFAGIKQILKYISVLKANRKQHLYNPLPHINLYYVIFNRNYHEIDKMVDLAMEVRADSVEFTPVDIVPGKTASLLMDKEQIAQVVQAVNEQASRLERYNIDEPVKVYIAQKDSFIKRINSPFAMEGKYEAETITKQPCYVGWAFARINADGSVEPCLKAHRLSVGSLYKHSFREIWNNPEQQLFRKKTFSLDFNDPYFQQIGNDPNYPCGCLKSCDNIQINVDIEKRLGETLRKNGRIQESNSR